MLEWCRGHTYYVQYFCNFLYEKLEHKISEFLKFSGLAQTSARRSVEALLDKDLLLREEDGIKVYNVFFSRFLERLE